MDQDMVHSLTLVIRVTGGTYRTAYRAELSITGE